MRNKIFLLLLALLLLAAACNKQAPANSGSTTGSNFNQNSSSNQSQTNSQTKLCGDWPAVSNLSGVNASLPSSIPIYPGSKLALYNESKNAVLRGKVANYCSGDDTKTISDFYNVQLRSNGWQFSKQDYPNVTTFIGSEISRVYNTIQINVSFVEKGKSLIQIVYGEPNK